MPVSVHLRATRHSHDRLCLNRSSAIAKPCGRSSELLLLFCWSCLGLVTVSASGICLSHLCCEMNLHPLRLLRGETLYWQLMVMDCFPLLRLRVHEVFTLNFLNVSSSLRELDAYTATSGTVDSSWCCWN